MRQTPDGQSSFPHPSYTTTRLPTRPELSPAKKTEVRNGQAVTPEDLALQLESLFKDMKAQFETVGFLSSEVVQVRLERSADHAIGVDVSQALRILVGKALEAAELPASLRVAVFVDECDELNGNFFRFSATAALHEGVHPENVAQVFENRLALQRVELRGPQMIDAI